MSQLAVKDASIGIDSEVVKTFFEPFFTTKEWMSTGIDLVVVYGIEKNLREVSS
jgi:C4-dicarboxylate-specific signal transduction histidine kinase